MYLQPHTMAPCGLLLYVWLFFVIQYQWFAALSNTDNVDKCIWTLLLKSSAHIHFLVSITVFSSHYTTRQIVSHHFCNAVNGNEAALYSFILLLTPSSLSQCFHVRLLKKLLLPLHANLMRASSGKL